ncbi:MAG: energy transducer TonB [Deltaproteobacteria bacterium]|nr:energy transducer TonB [Deltaproteobacteria bacterium]
MSENRPGRNFKPLLVALLIALLVHAELIFTGLLPGMYDWFADLVPKPKVEENTEVTLLAMSPRDFEANRQILPEVKVEENKEKLPPEPEVPEEEKKKEEEDPEGQVVDLAPTPDKKPPEDARFLSEHNTQVEKESISRHRRSDYGVAQPRPTIAESTRRRPEPQQDEGLDDVALLTRKQGDQQQATEYKMPAFEVPDLKKRDALHLKLDLQMGEMAAYDASEAMSGNSDKLRLQKGDGSERASEQTGEQGQHESTVAMFRRPSLDQLDMVTGAPANDHVEDVDEGEATLLNSKEFKYATFFNRVKRGVSQYWSPKVGAEYIRRDPYGNIYGVKDRYTLLNVSLEKSGALSQVFVVTSSGVKFFDEVAVRSFHDAAPFANPPAGLADADGIIRFQFGFFFEIGDRGRIRAFRFDRR